MNELGVGGDVLRTGTEVDLIDEGIEDPDLMSLCQEQLHHMGADEAGTAGYEYGGIGHEFGFPFVLVWQWAGIEKVFPEMALTFDQAANSAARSG